MQEAVLTKSYAVEADFSDADMTNAVIDRVDFTGVLLASDGQFACTFLYMSSLLYTQRI